MREEPRSGRDGALRLSTDGQSLAPLDVLRRFRAHSFALTDFLLSRVEANPSKTFLVFEDRSWTYEAFAADVNACAALLATRGIKPGDRVGVMSPNHPGTAMLLFALARIGAVLVPANPAYGPEKAAYVFEHAGISGLVAAPAMLEVVEDAVGRMSSRPWILLNEADPGSIHLVLADELAAAGALPPPEPVGHADTTCSFIYTSGTTGSPKGVMHGQAGAVLTGEGFVGRMNLQPEDRLLCVLPLFHVNALFYSLCGTVACGLRTLRASGRP